MSWLARSFVSSLRGDEDDDDDVDREPDRPEYKSPTAAPEAEEGGEGQQQQPGTPSRGVKEDFSELTKTLTRQFWGVASFLAPPPTAGSPPSEGYRPPDATAAEEDAEAEAEAEAEVAESPRMAGIRSDFAEIGGRFRSGISILSSNKAVSEISKIASTFLPFGLEEAEEEEGEGGEERSWNGSGAIGVTEEVLAFARNISMHPETWLDFPLLPDEDESDDFDMSDVQQEHALAVEHLAPRLAALRIELCPSHMSEACFWKIYFVLLHPRLNKHDAELLSTPQIVEARAKLQGLQSRTKQGLGRPEGGVSYRKEVLTPVPPEEHFTSPPSILNEATTPKFQALEEPTSLPVMDFETEKHAVMSTEVKIIDKSIIEEDPPVQSKNKELSGDNSKITIHKYDEDGDEWLEEDTGEMSSSGVTPVPLGDEEDVSFSDLEEDDDQSMPKSSKMASGVTASQEKDSRGWVQLNKSSEGSGIDGKSPSPQSKESNDWLDVDVIDEV